MPTDPYVPVELDDRPRQEPNLAPGVHLPPARAWRADRPGDLLGGQPEGELLGVPGPNIGYALTLAQRVKDRLALTAHEHAHDALALVGELAMKRAASYGRAPVATDVESAMLVLGYTGGAAPDFAAWRTQAVQDAAHDYPRRRGLCDAVDVDVVRLAPAALSERLAEVRAAFRDAASRELEGLAPS